MFRSIYTKVPGIYILLMVAASIFMTTVVMQNAAKRIYEVSHRGVIPDLKLPTYHPEEAITAVTEMGEQGRQIYKEVAYREDLLYPIIYGFTLVLIIAYLWHRAAPNHILTGRLCIVPKLAVIFDYAENFTIIKLINQYPEQQLQTAQMASGFTLLKWAFVLLSLLLILAGGVAWLIKRMTD